MKVFISWAGTRSKEVAELFKTWLPCVLQASKPWVSSKDIQSGSLWFNEISGQLADTTIGIVCLTAENKDRPWILFESGALTKGLSSNRVCPFLVDLKKADVQAPLAQLNMTDNDEEGVMSLVGTINDMLTEPLTKDTLQRVFRTNWPDFDSEMKTILSKPLKNPPLQPRTSDDLLNEVLLSIRDINSRIKTIEANTPDPETVRRNSNGGPISRDISGLVYSTREYLRYLYYNAGEFPSKEQTVYSMLHNYDLPIERMKDIYDNEYEKLMKEAKEGLLVLNKGVTSKYI